MRAFAALYRALDETTSTAAKVRLLAGWLGTVPPRDAAWAVHFLIGRRPKRLVRLPLLRAWAAEAAGVPPWLFDESYQAVGDLAETVALLMPGTREGDEAPLAEWVERRLLPLAGADLATQRATLLHAWRTLGRDECLVWNKLITGAFRVGLSDGLVVRALARHLGRPEATIAHRLMGPWDPADDFLARLAADDAPQAPHRPYPFCLAHPLDMPPAELGAPDAWVAEWKWDGIRAQLVRRAGRSWLWSRGEELLDGRFPEVETAATRLPDGTVRVNGLMPLEEFNDVFGLNLVDPNYETIAGYVMGRLDRIPKIGDEVQVPANEHETLCLRVEQMDGKRIARLVLRTTPAPGRA